MKNMHKSKMQILINMTNITKIKSVKKMYIISVRRGGKSQIWYIISERRGVKNMVHNFGEKKGWVTNMVHNFGEKGGQEYGTFVTSLPFSLKLCTFSSLILSS
jgi:hypothetical protein